VRQRAREPNGGSSRTAVARLANVSVRFGAVVPESAGGGEIPGTLQAMSDDVNLYVAVRLELPTPAFDQSHATTGRRMRASRT
jgi:hypothetical protein